MLHNGFIEMDIIDIDIFLTTIVTNKVVIDIQKVILQICFIYLENLSIKFGTIQDTYGHHSSASRLNVSFSNNLMVGQQVFVLDYTKFDKQTIKPIENIFVILLFFITITVFISCHSSWLLSKLVSRESFPENLSFMHWNELVTTGELF